MIFVILFAIFFMIFMVFFPLFWALAFCGCWFLPLTKFSKVLISVLILAMLCGGIAFLFFDDKDSVYPFLFACGFISLPVFLYYFWRSQESYEKYYHIIHTNPLAKNNLWISILLSFIIYLSLVSKFFKTYILYQKNYIYIRNSLQK